MPILTGGIRLPHEYGQQRIVTQIVVIVEVFISQAQPVYALPNQFFDRVLDQFRITMIDEAPRKSGEDPRPGFDLPQPPASEVIAPPSNRAPPRRPKP